MLIIFEFNSKEQYFLTHKDKMRLDKTSFPIKIKLIDNNGKEKERTIHFREKCGEPKLIMF